jgi:hypothetical protein
VHPKIVQERLGHSQISLTLDIYSHVLPTMQEEAARKLDSLLEASVDDQRGRSEATSKRLPADRDYPMGT